MSEVEQSNKHLLIKESDAQAILNYLASRPYHEVHNLAGLLLSLPVGQPLQQVVDVTPSGSSEQAN